MTADSWIVADASVVAPLLPSTMPASNSSNETSSRSHGYVASVQSPSEMTPCTTASDASSWIPSINDCSPVCGSAARIASKIRESNR